MYKCEFFQIQELVPPKIFEKRAERSWELLDERLLFALDQLRGRYGKMTVNNWRWGGDRMWSGLRTPGSPFYSSHSQHSFGRAADILFDDVSAEDVRKDIQVMPDAPEFNLICAVELDVPWLHIDIRNCERVFFFKA